MFYGQHEDPIQENVAAGETVNQLILQYQVQVYQDMEWMVVTEAII